MSTDGGGRVTWPQLGAVLAFVGNAIFWGLFWILSERFGDVRKDLEVLRAHQEESKLESARRFGIAEVQCRYMRDLVRELRPESVPYPCPRSRTATAPAGPDRVPLYDRIGG